MPSAVVHLKAAYDLKDILSVKDTGQFYVGAVSPDAVNIDGFAPQDIRYPAHIRSTDYAQWKHNVADYIIDKSDDYKNNTDFFKGFLLHILTDIFWDELVQPLLFSALQENGAAAQQLRELKWQELYRFNAALAGDWLYKEVLPKIGEVTRFDGISTVTPEVLEKYDLWFAYWTTIFEPSYRIRDCGIWQHTSCHRESYRRSAWTTWHGGARVPMHRDEHIAGCCYTSVLYP